ncbi:MAG: TraX family protein [Lachnospiraceae bacterium]|nr:TraX family protein [Lachnospiraceae bacterium]
METTTKKRGINSNTLKIIAMAIMLIDHIGAVILERKLIFQGIADVTEENAAAFLAQNSTLYWADFIMRNIGRIAFPIFLFLLFEGFRHTHDRRSYACRLAIFALISEIPFDLALTGKVFSLVKQSVGVTLLLVLLLFCLLDYLEQSSLPKMGIFVAQILSVAVFAVLGILGRCDYGASGILAAAAIYFFRKTRLMSMATGCLALSALSTAEIPAFLSLIPIHFYNGEKGKTQKYVFYAFYPVHLLLLYGIACLLGLGGVAMF